MACCCPCSLNNCVGILIRQTICVNGVPNTSENFYTNLSVGSIIPLKYGYSMTLTSALSESTIITITGVNFALSVTIDVGTYKAFDLPVEGGRFELYIGLFNSCKISR